MRSSFMKRNLIQKRTFMIIIILFFVLGCILKSLYTHSISTVSSSTKEKNPYVVFVDLNHLKLHVFKDNTLFKSYPISGGKSRTPSPLGVWKIISKANWGEGFGGSWMGFNVPWGKYGIHGTDEPWSIGRSLSKGCIRMYSKDAKDLKSYIPIGTKVVITKGSFGLFGDTFRTLKPGARGSDVFAIQLRLREMGYYNGSIDGIYGPGLEQSLKKLCKNKNIPFARSITLQIYEAMGLFPFE